MFRFSKQFLKVNKFFILKRSSFYNSHGFALALKMRCDERLRMRLLYVVAFSKKLRWLVQTKVITLKTHLHAVNGENDCRNAA